MQHERKQNTTGEREMKTKKPKSRLHAYVRILAAPSGVDVQVVFDSIRKDMSYILRLQMQKHKRLFLRWSPKLNLDVSVRDLKLEQAEAALVLNSCEQVFRMVTQGLHDRALPPWHFCHALHGSIVQCTRVDAGTHSGAAAGDILWHAMCARCLQELRMYVQSRGLKKVDISPRPDLVYVRMLQIKQVGHYDLYVFQPEPTRHDDWPCKTHACAACDAMSGIIRKYEPGPNGADKADGGGARKSKAQAQGGPPRSFQRIFQQQCSDYFESESQTTQPPGDRVAASGGARVGSCEDEEGDSDYECEDLLSSDDERDAGAGQRQGSLGWNSSDNDCDGGVDQGHGNVLTLDGDDLDVDWSVDQFFGMDRDMENNVEEFLLNMGAASPVSQTGAAGAEVCPGTGAATGIGMQMEPHAADERPSLMDYGCSPGSVPPSAGAGACTSTAAATGAESQTAVPEHGVLPPASPVASASASTDTGTVMEPQAAVQAPGQKRSAIDYVLNPGLVPSSASAGVAFALRMLQQSVQANTREAPAQ